MTPSNHSLAASRSIRFLVMVRLSLIALLAFILLVSIGKTPALSAPEPSEAIEDSKLVALQATPTAQTNPSPGGLTRRTTPPAAADRGTQCQRVQADWVNNLPSRSWVTGAVVFFIVLVFIFTPIGFSTSFVRMFCAFVVAIILGPLVVGLQKHAALKICPDSIGFLGIMTSDLFVWTLVGIAATALVLILIRYPLTKRKLNTRPTA